jgi:acyl-CoA synthetase (AMP-forming)/AMP-acid ligase II
MELDEVPVEVCVDIGVDGTVNLFALLDQAAQRFPDRGAVYHGGRRRCTWRELRDRALRLAGSIRQQWPAGARIAIASENRPETVELLFGIWAAECVAVPINYKLHPREMMQILDDASVSQVFASATVAAGLGSGCGCPVEVVAGVVGAPDAELGEIVVAFIVGSVDPGELDAHLLQRIARFKRPKRYLAVDQLPKNSYGKV